MRRLLSILFLCGTVLQLGAAHRPTRYHVRATAFCLHGITAAGTRSTTGTVAADPAFLPIGTTIRVHDAGAYSGVYVVTDTGRKIVGRSIDLRLGTTAAARQFGKKIPWISVVKWGTGEVNSAGSADRVASKETHIR